MRLNGDLETLFMIFVLMHIQNYDRKQLYGYNYINN